MVGDEGDESGRPLQFGYSGEPSGPAYEFWREEFCRRVLVADVVPIQPGPIKCRMTAAPLPGISVTHFEGTAAHFIARGGDPGGDLALVMPPSTPTRFVIKGRTLDLGATDIGLADAALEGADVAIHEDGALRAMFISRKALLDVCPNAEDLLARPLAASEGVRSLLSQYHRIVLETAHTLDPLARTVVAQHLIDLAALALGAGRDATEAAKGRGLAAARFEAVKRTIVEQLASAGLSLKDVARHHRASPRYIQMLFERAGTTFSEFVIEQRLLLAHRLLRSPLNCGRKVSDIAHMAGFGDVSYFHRAFRRRFGATPAEVRAQAASSG